MRITLHGAGGDDVTGSAYHVQTNGASCLVDFGLFQGVTMAEERNRLPHGLDVPELQAVLLTHAHLDHTGRLPLLTRGGYAGPIYATPATVDLTGLILRDTAKVQAHDLVRTNRKRERAGKPPLEPLYSAADVEATLQLCRPVPYEQPVPVAPGIQARFAEAGHLLGSASIALSLEAQGRQHTVVFSGDLGPQGTPILKDPVPFTRADAVFLESTYGDHDHRPLPETIAEFQAIVQKTVEHRGRILVPTFAVGRAQLLAVLLTDMFRQQVVPRFPVFLDSPMAVEATQIYSRHPELFDAEMTAVLRGRPLSELLAGIQLSVTADESKALNDVAGPCLILAGAGMCHAGRILHHLKQSLWRPGTAVIIVGYQADGSLGRRLVEGAQEVSILGDKIAVRASVHTLGGFSAHAGQSDLLHWFGAMAPSRPRLFLTHGEAKGREPLARLLRERYGLVAHLPASGETIDLDMPGPPAA
jgi:metallo-beta-lactamase family protein